MKYSVSLVLVLILTVSVCLGQQVLFSDDFTTGMDDAWTNADGGWVAENGHLAVTSACGFQTCNPNIYAGGSEQANYLISFDFMVTEAFTYHGSGVGFYVALSDPIEPDEGAVSGYSIGFGWSSDGNPVNANCEIQRVDTGTHLGLATGEQFWIEPMILYHAVLGRIGSDLVVKKWSDSEPEPDWQMVVTDDSFQSGYWMPIWWNNVGWIDNFEVTGYGAVSNDDMTWGGVKTLYR